MRITLRTVFAMAAVAAAATGLSGCVNSSLHIADDYGRAVRADIVAQVDDPDAKYVGIPQPGTDGRRVGLAQTRYGDNQVIQPASTATSTVSIGGGGGGGGGAPR